ncbi:MAG: hypothetical protein ACPGEE_04830 [Opitutales bacterium]
MFHKWRRRRDCSFHFAIFSRFRSFRRTVQIPYCVLSTNFVSGGDGGIAHFISPSTLRSVKPEGSSSLISFLSLVSQVAETEGFEPSEPF